MADMLIFVPQMQECCGQRSLSRLYTFRNVLLLSSLPQHCVIHHQSTTQQQPGEFHHDCSAVILGHVSCYLTHCHSVVQYHQSTTHNNQGNSITTDLLIILEHQAEPLPSQSRKLVTLKNFSHTAQSWSRSRIFVTLKNFCHGKASVTEVVCSGW